MTTRRSSDETPPSAVDARLREALEPSSGTVDRLVARALEAKKERPLWLPVAALTAVALVLVVLFMVPRSYRPDDRTITIRGRGGIVTIQSPTGDTWVLLPGGTE